MRKHQKPKKEKCGAAGKLRLTKILTLEEVAREIYEYTHFSIPECTALLTMHARITAEEKMDRMLMRNIMYSALNISDSFVLDRIFRLADKDDDDCINGEEWVMILSVLLRGTLHEMTEFCYSLYDINGDRSLEREEILMFLEHSFKPRGEMHTIDIAEAVRDVVHITMTKLDGDNDGIITFGDYKNAVERDPLMLQCLGACLPPERKIKTFQSIFTWDYSQYLSISGNAVDYSNRHRVKQKVVKRKKTNNQLDATSVLSLSYFKRYT